MLVERLQLRLSRRALERRSDQVDMVEDADQGIVAAELEVEGLMGCPARQVVRHGHVQVNGRKVNIPSFQCKVGDEIAIREGSKSLVLLEAAKDFVSGQNRVQWLQVAADGLSGKVVALPTRADVNLPVNEQLIVELYSK